MLSSLRVLHWILCARSLRISLPEDKHHSWSKDILDCLDDKGASYKSFESLFGRLENAAMIIPQARYFMNRLRSLLKGKPEVCPMIKLTASTTADLDLWLH